MKKNMILMSILAAALLAGCSDNDDKAAIADGTLGCSVNASGAEFVTVWNNGAWKQKEECKGSCNDGVCLSTESVCSGNASECVADITDLSGTKSLLRTCSNGEYRYTNCALLGNKVCGASGDSVACIDNAGAASKDCVDGLYRCNLAGDREYCSDGKWAKTACPQDQVCSAGECVAKPLVCNEGKKVCDGLVPKVCQNNELVAKPSCDEAKEACVDGECVALPKAGDSCLLPNGSVFQSSCSNGTLYECYLKDVNKGYTVQTDKCDDNSKGTVCLNLSSGAVCAHKNDSTLMKEVGACTAEGDVSFLECYKHTNNRVYLFAIQCVEADGVLYGKEITPESVCDGNTRISCDSQTGAKVEESCIECNYSSRFEQAQCVTENGGGSNSGGGGNNGGGGNGGGGNGGGGNGGPTCALYLCPDTPIQGGGTAGDACTSKGYDSPLCDGKGSVYCANRNAAEDSTCQGGETAYTFPKNDGSTQTQCVLVGDDASCLTGGGGGNGGGGNGGATCDIWNCGLSNSAYLEDCKGYGYDSAVCFIDDKDGKMYYDCLNRQSAQDASCASGKTAWEQDGETFCLIAGEDQACLTGGDGGATDDDTAYECSSEKLSTGETLLDACKSKYPDQDMLGVLCAECSSSWICVDDESALTLIGTSLSAALGRDFCD